MVHPHRREPPGARRRPDPQLAGFAGDDEQPPGPVDWNTLPAQEAAVRWVELDAWVSWLRTAYGLSVLEIPPLWHRHDELVVGAVGSAPALAGLLRRRRGSAPLQWHRDFDDARHRLRRWVAACGTQSTADRPTLVPSWPGEALRDVEPARTITDRDGDRDMVRADVQERIDAAEAITANVASGARSRGA